jgi:hypothetical protein
VKLVLVLGRRDAIRKALGVTVWILDEVYETGRKCAADFKQNMKLIFDDHLPKWN